MIQSIKQKYDNNINKLIIKKGPIKGEERVLEKAEND